MCTYQLSLATDDYYLSTAKLQSRLTCKSHKSENLSKANDKYFNLILNQLASVILISCTQYSLRNSRKNTRKLVESEEEY